MTESPNIADSFVRAALENSQRIGIIDSLKKQSITFADINTRSDAYAHYFSGAGVKPGNIVILMVKPSIDFVCLALALFKVGAPVVLIDPGMGYKNLLRCISRVSPDYMVGIPKAVLFSKLFASHFQTVIKTFCCGNSLSLLGPDIRRQTTEGSAAYPVYKPTPDDLAAIIFTTGSTGPPKGVRYEHTIFAAQLKLIKEYYEIGPKDIDQPAFPLFALFATALGACAVIPDMDPTQPASVDPKKFIRSIQEHAVTYSFGSPAIWNVVSRYCLSNNIVLGTVKKVLMAGAPVPCELLQRVKKILPADAKIYTPYGATESLPIVSIESSEVLSETWELTRDGKGTCVGRPLPEIEVRIIAISEEVITDVRSDMFLETGEIGEIIVRGPVVTRAYQNNPDETALAKIQDEAGLWHRMGDVGYLDHKGRLWFCGRRAHRVETDTGTLFSIPCEAIVNEHPAVYRSALVGVKKGSKTIPALVVEPTTDSNPNAEQLLAEVRLLAKKHFLTAGIEHFLIHSKFPVDIRHNAKIFREKLAQWASKKISH